MSYVERTCFVRAVFSTDKNAPRGNKSPFRCTRNVLMCKFIAQWSEVWNDRFRFIGRDHFFEINGGLLIACLLTGAIHNHSSTLGVILGSRKVNYGIEISWEKRFLVNIYTAGFDSERKHCQGSETWSCAIQWKYYHHDCCSIRGMPFFSHPSFLASDREPFPVCRRKWVVSMFVPSAGACRENRRSASWGWP